MKKLIFLLMTGLSLAGLSRNLSDDPNYEFEVRFTNPLCRTYNYAEEVLSNNGAAIQAKPKNAFCTFADTAASANRRNSVQSKLLAWIRDPVNEEIFFSALSFSNSSVREALCSAADRGVKIQFVLDSQTELKEAKALAKCGQGDRKPTYMLRGGGEGTGYSHSKFFIFNPYSTDKTRIIFSSGNVSSGTALHHESWNFLQTSTDSHFAQKKVCLMQTLIAVDSSSKTDFLKAWNSCVGKIKVVEEQDLQMRVSIADTEEITNFIQRNARQSQRMHVAAHRFSMGVLVESMQRRLNSGKAVSFVADDDLYWAGNENFEENKNTLLEWNLVKKLMGSGMDARFLQTNHWANLFQHNRMLIFDTEMLIGSANWTNAGLTKNFESFYLVKDTSIVETYARQFEYLHSELASSVEEMPRQNIQPRM